MIPSFLVIDKPVDLTSHDVVAILRAVTGAKKVGHTGTLDPFATGVLPLALGPVTRLIQYLDEDLKVYEALIQLGAATDTGDPTGVVIREAPVPPLVRAEVEAVLAGFLGIRMQEPPRHSAVKVRGRPLYSYARAGEEMRAAPRPIRVDSIEILTMEGDQLGVRITCGRGTYARVLAEEIGQALGTEGHLAALARARSGPFSSADAIGLDKVSEIVSGLADWSRALRRPKDGSERIPWRPREEVWEGLRPHLISPAAALSHLPEVQLPLALRARFENGGAPPPAPPDVAVGSCYRVQVGEELLAIAERQEQGPLVRCRVGAGS